MSDLQNKTLAELVRMGYVVTLQAPQTGAAGGTHMHYTLEKNLSMDEILAETKKMIEQMNVKLKIRDKD